MLTIGDLLQVRPSYTLCVGLTALQEFENTQGCRVIMTRFHDYDAKTCFACLGGAAALKVLGVAYNTPVKNYAALADLAKVSQLQLQDYEYTFEYFRNGDIGNAFNQMQCGYYDGVKFNRPIRGYHQNPDGFFADMYELADELEAAGF